MVLCAWITNVHNAYTKGDSKDNGTISMIEPRY